MGRARVAGEFALCPFFRRLCNRTVHRRQFSSVRYSGSGALLWNEERAVGASCVGATFIATCGVHP
jgi:hypothetical protein